MSQRPHILMCSPIDFDCTYSINPWMDANIGQVNQSNAIQQWNKLKTALENEVNAVIHVMPSARHVPDLVFTANAGLIIGNKAVVSTFRYPERQPETALYAIQFDSFGYDTIIPPHHVTFEGAGDCLQTADGVFWVGSGWRSTNNTALWLHGVFPDEIFISLNMNKDSRFYHLDTCFAPLSGGEIVWYPPAFDWFSQEKIRAHGDTIELTEEDASVFACNLVNIGDVVIVNRPSLKLTEELTSRGYRVVPVDMSEFIKSGGSAKCLTLRMK